MRAVHGLYRRMLGLRKPEPVSEAGKRLSDKAHEPARLAFKRTTDKLCAELGKPRIKLGAWR